VAPIVNCTAFVGTAFVGTAFVFGAAVVVVPAASARCVDWSDTSESAGMSASRSSTCATVACETAVPVTTKLVGAEADPVVEDANDDAGALDVVVEVEGVDELVVDGVEAGDVPLPSLAWRLTSEAPEGMTRESWLSRSSQAIRPVAADVIAVICACVAAAAAAEDALAA